VNTFLDPEGSPTIVPDEVIRSRDEEKQYAISSRKAVQEANAGAHATALKALQRAAIENENTFSALMNAAKVCTLGEMTHALYEVGGQYRRNM
jgi:methylmalonyl-CoA mutase